MSLRSGIALILLAAVAVGLWLGLRHARNDGAPAPPAGPALGQGSEPTAKPNVILVSVDTLRADHLGAYGYDRPTSPFLDSLARRAVVFESAFANASWTLPSHMSLLTGTYPRTHGVEQVDRTLGPAIPTLAELLRGAGYATEAFVSWVFLQARYGFDRGFDHYRELLPEQGATPSGHENALPASATVDRVIQWARTAPDRPYFLFVHLFDPHMDYAPPLEHARVFDPTLKSTAGGGYEHLKQYIRGLHVQDVPPIPSDELATAVALYDGEIRYVDDQLRRLFGALEAEGLLDHSVVIVTSDHGEELNDHGSMEGHQWTLYDEVLHVPLIVRLPEDALAGLRIPTVVQSIDVAPFVLARAGLEAPSSWEGRDLQRLLTPAAGDAPWDEVVSSHIQRFNVKAALRTPSHKLILTIPQRNAFGRPDSGQPELYDLRSDPQELENIYTPTDAVAQDLGRRLRAAMQRPTQATTEAKPLGDDDLERLRALGYVQ